MLCVPPADLFDARYAGVIPFLREGAAPLMSPDDLLSPYDSYYPPVPSEAILIVEDSAARGVPLRYAETITDEITANEAAETFQRTAGEPAPQPENRPQPEPEPEKQAPLPDDPQERAIVEYLRVHGDTHADDIAAALDMDLSELLNALLSLEIQGYVESLFGKQYRAFAM